MEHTRKPMKGTMLESYKVRNALYGLAVGNAMTHKYEPFHFDEMSFRRGFSSELDVLAQKKAHISEDTQVSIALLRAFSDWQVNGSIDEHFINYAAHRLSLWTEDKRNNQSPNNTCMYSMRKLVEEERTNGVSVLDMPHHLLSAWGRIHAPVSLGSGTVMRSPWLGIPYAQGQVTLEQLDRFNHDQAAMTHGSAEAGDVSQLASLIVADLLVSHDMTREHMLSLIDDFMLAPHVEDAQGALKEMQKTLHAIPLEWYDEEDHEQANISRYFADGRTGPEVLGCAIAITVAAKGNPDHLILRSAFNSHDSDTIGAVAGAFLGAGSNDPQLWERYIPRLDKFYLEEMEMMADILLPGTMPNE